MRMSTWIAATAMLAALATPAMAQSSSSSSQSSSSSSSQSGARASAGARATGGNASSGGAAEAAGGAGGSANGGNFNSSFRDRRQPAAIGLAGLAASSACLGSASIGGSGPGAGFGFGMTYLETHCDARENARLLISLGYRAQGVQLLVNEIPTVAKVMQDAQQITYTRNGRPVRYAANGNPANGGRPDPSCKQWLFGNVGGTCVR